MFIDHTLLSNLHRLASGQDENFITESFAYLLRHLISAEPSAAIVLLSRITNGILDLASDELIMVDIKTQVVTDFGKPDIEIRTNRHLIFIEVKVDSGFGDCQLERYRNHLNDSGCTITSLIALTRYPFINDQNCNFSLRWHNIADFLSEIRVTNEVTSFIIQQFIELLNSRGLAMEKVGWELISGVRSLQVLTDLIAEALAAMKVATHRGSAAWEWRGFYIEGGKFFIGVYFVDPNLVVLNTEVPLSRKAPKEALVGSFQDGGWSNQLDLTSEDVHFFARTKASQIQCLENFIERSLSFGRTLV